MDVVVMVVIGLTLVASLVGVGAYLWSQRIAEPPAPQLPPGRQTRYPVALLHGAFGFDELVVREQRHVYFNGVPERLESHGIVVHRPTVAPIAGITRRAAQLATQLRDLPGTGKVNLIAHSMGGLDARYALAYLGLADRVAALVTVGTPHRGTPLADLGHAVGRRIGLPRIIRDAGDMLSDLTTEQMVAFNDEVPDVEGVFYASVVGRIPPDASTIHPLLAPIHRLLRTQVGESDGLIPVTSQEWGEVLMIVDADHWAQVGWSPADVDTPAIYEAIVDALRERGF